MQTQALQRGSFVRLVLALLAVVPGVLRVGWDEPIFDAALLHGVQFALMLLYGINLLRARMRVPKAARAEFDKIHRPERLFLLVGLTLGAWSWVTLAIMGGGLAVTQMLRAYLLVVQTARIPSGIVFVGSFVLLIAVGTGGLLLPAATPADQPISVLDATFTITSAISQTGLVVRSTGEGFTRFGQVIILIWIQIGALGIIVFGALLASVLGSSFGLKATQTIAEGTEQGWAGQLSLQKLVTFIIVFTHGIELIGALLLYVTWPETWPGAPDMSTPGDRLYHAVFFSVSSFCNAGFVTTEGSLRGLRTDWTTHAIVAPLIVLGSIGFPVLENVFKVAWSRVRGRRVENGSLIRLNLNTKIILTTTLVVYVLGFIIIFLGELAQAVPGVVDGPGTAAFDAHFMNINRTAGFDTISPNDMGLLSQLALIFLMFIGGSPGSVAGGIKLMAFAVLSLTIWATINGRRETTAFGRTLPDELVRKCAALVVMCLAGLLITCGVLAITEHAHGMGAGPWDGTVPGLDVLLFEAVSAFGTCGLSMGITPDLSPMGRAAIIVSMFVGRVGPLAITASLIAVAARRRVRYSYPTEDVVVY